MRINSALLSTGYYISTAALITLLLQHSCSGSNYGNKDHQITDDCLDCIEKVSRSEKECVTNLESDNVRDSVMFCGAYKITKYFHDECIIFLNASTAAVLTAWTTYEGCYKDKRCSRECVRAYHNFYGKQCHAALARPLTCADFGTMHSAGPHTCYTPPAKQAETYRQNMSLLCGCQTVYGSRDACLNALTPVTPYDQATRLADETLLIVVGCICALILITVSILCVFYVSKHKISKHHCRSCRSDSSDGIVQSSDSVLSQSQVVRAKTAQLPPEDSTRQSSYKNRIIHLAQRVKAAKERANHTYVNTGNPDTGLKHALRVEVPVVIESSPESPVPPPEYRRIVSLDKSPDSHDMLPLPSPDELLGSQAPRSPLQSPLSSPALSARDYRLSTVNLV